MVYKVIYHADGKERHMIFGTQKQAELFAAQLGTKFRIEKTGY